MTASSSAPQRRSRVALGSGGEFDRIRSFLSTAREPGAGVRVGPGDDALVLDDGTVISTDISVEDVHFRREWVSLDEAGYRAAAAGMSDLAAMAAEPLGALVSLAVPDDGDPGTGRALMQGVREALAVVGGVLLGGDLSASPGPVVLDVVSVGRADDPVVRAGARPGDELWVTGRVGGAAGAVRTWLRGGTPDSGLRRRFARPEPRIREARWLAREAGVRALIDLSDGLAGDAGHLAAASGVRMVLEAGRIPLHPALAEHAADPGRGEEERREEALDAGLRGGEDYELLLAAEPGSVEPLLDEFAVRFGVPLTRVGRVEDGEGVHLLRPGAAGPEPLEGGGFGHFSDPAGSGDRAGDEEGGSGHGPVGGER